MERRLICFSNIFLHDELIGISWVLRGSYWTKEGEVLHWSVQKDELKEKTDKKENGVFCGPIFRL